MHHKQSALGRLPRPRAKRKATLLASLLMEDSRQVKVLRGLRDDIATAAFAYERSGGGFNRGLSLALDRAQVALEEANV